MNFLIARSRFILEVFLKGTMFLLRNAFHCFTSSVVVVFAFKMLFCSAWSLFLMPAHVVPFQFSLFFDLLLCFMLIFSVVLCMCLRLRSCFPVNALSLKQKQIYECYQFLFRILAPNCPRYFIIANFFDLLVVLLPGLASRF